MIKKTDKSSWESPIVVVLKYNNTVRICIDYKATINQSVEDEQYVLQTKMDYILPLSVQSFFGKLDFSRACAQLNVYQESQEYFTISTHKGLYSYLKLPYGVKSSRKIFQAKRHQIFQGIEKCVRKKDGILVGRNDWK